MYHCSKDKVSQGSSGNRIIPEMCNIYACTLKTLR